jgi:pSer/pThr/pTyr-binding forkhead associated (FHA) protein
VTVAAIAVDEALLLLKLGFLVLLYLFLWRVVRSASRDLRTPQESFVLAPQQQPPKQPKPRVERRTHGRLVAVNGSVPGLERVYEIDAAAVTVGRGSANDIALEDDFASVFHARVEARQDGVWIEDVGSTNGTAVNGSRISAPTKLRPGDLIRIGETDLRFER